MLKIKLAMAIIGISSIHLLRTFIEAGNIGQPGARYTQAAALWQTIIHITFIVSAIGRSNLAQAQNSSSACFQNCANVRRWPAAQCREYCRGKPKRK